MDVMERNRLVGLLILAAVVAAGCGRKAPPLPPQLRLADQTRDLAALQRGSTAVLEWSYPSITTAGGALPDVETVEVWRTTLPLAQEPQGTTLRDRQIKIQLIESQGEVVVALDGEGLAQATRGPKLRIEDDLQQWRESVEVAGEPVIWYAVRTMCCGKRASAFSNIARVVPQSPPPPPQWEAAAGSRDGIDLSWRQEEGLTTLVERSAADGEWLTLTAEPVVENQWRDTQAAQGRAWTYRLRSVQRVEDVGQVVGEPGLQRVVEHPDVYPPAAPANLVCLPEGELVRLRWAGAARGLTFRVYRSLGGPNPRLIMDNHTATEFEDTEPPYGRLTYAVRAVDLAGNESESATCETVIGAEP
jgi:hypothetical protein